MLKLAEKYDVEFSYLLTNVRRWVDVPSSSPARPIPKHLNWVTHYEPGKYDLAILHLDQQAADPAIGKGQIYRQLNELIQDIPKIVVNHGTPMWDDFFTEDVVINGGTVHNTRGIKEIDGIKKIVGDNFMIVNSYDAVDRWGWGYPLIHGLDPDEWWDLPKEPRVTISLSPGGLDKYYNRQLLTAIKGRVKEMSNLDVQHITINFLSKSWDDYRNFLGRSLIYINPTLDSPMPRSRTEAMMSGCCILTSRHHNADEFIKMDNNINGFIIKDNPLDYAETISQLINHNYRDAVAIGERGRETAIKYFNKDRYLKDLWHIVTEVANGRKPVWDGKKVWDD